MVRTKILALTGALVAVSTLAWAASPHFNYVKSTALDSNVQVCWKEAGLGRNEVINYTASASATATYVCVNHGGQCPNAANKVTISGPVSTSAPAHSDKNGNITSCLPLNAPGAGKFKCPGGQKLTLSEVSYTNIQLADTTTPLTQAADPSSQSASPFTCP